MAVAILKTLSRDQNRKYANLQDLLNFLHLKTIKGDYIILKDCILDIRLHFFALEWLLF